MCSVLRCDLYCSIGVSKKVVRKAKGIHLLLLFCITDFRHYLKEVSSFSLCIQNTEHYVCGSACVMQHKSQNCLSSWVAGLINSSKKAQKQIKIELMDSTPVKEMFPKVASKPWLWACCAMTSSHCSTQSSLCHGKVCQITQCVVQNQCVSTVGIWSALLCHCRYQRQISVLPEWKSPISYSLEGGNAVSYLLEECWNIWSWLWGYITPLKLQRVCHTLQNLNKPCRLRDQLAMCTGQIYLFMLGNKVKYYFATLYMENCNGNRVEMCLTPLVSYLLHLA